MTRAILHLRAPEMANANTGCEPLGADGVLPARRGARSRWADSPSSPRTRLLEPGTTCALSGDIYRYNWGPAHSSLGGETGAPHTGPRKTAAQKSTGAHLFPVSGKCSAPRPIVWPVTTSITNRHASPRSVQVLAGMSAYRPAVCFLPGGQCPTPRQPTLLLDSGPSFMSLSRPPPCSHQSLLARRDRSAPIPVRGLWTCTRHVC